MKTLWNYIKNMFKKKERKVVIEQLFPKEKHPIHILALCKDNESMNNQFFLFSRKESQYWNKLGGRILTSTTTKDTIIVKREYIWLQCKIVGIHRNRDIAYRGMSTDILYVDSRLHIDENTLFPLISGTKCSKTIRYF